MYDGDITTIRDTMSLIFMLQLYNYWPIANGKRERSMNDYTYTELYHICIYRIYK